MPDPSLTFDAFLNGRINAWQPERGYRAGTDAVTLAAAVPAEPGQSVLDVGCGVGVVGLCLAARVEGVVLSGIEVQANYAALARRNAEQNKIAFEILEADVAALPLNIRDQQFDHVVTNPPFFDDTSHSPALDQGRQIAHNGVGLPLTAWLRTCQKRVRPKGHLTLIHQADVLPEILSVLSDGFGGIEIFPITAREGRQAKRVIVRGKAGSRSPATLHAPLIVHEGPTHNDEINDYSLKFRSILRDGAAIC